MNKGLRICRKLVGKTCLRLDHGSGGGDARISSGGFLKLKGQLGVPRHGKSLYKPYIVNI